MILAWASPFNTMKYGEGVLYNLVFTEWRHCVPQNEVWGRGCYITLFSPSDVTAFQRIVLRLFRWFYVIIVSQTARQKQNMYYFEQL